MKSFARVSRQGASLICTIALLATSFAYTFGQQQTVPSKRPLRHQDYDSWHSIQAPQISRDGKFVAYAFMAQDGDSEIVARNVATGAEWRAPRGYHPPVPPPDDPGANIGEFQAAQARLTRPVFAADNRFVVFSAEPTKAEVARAKKEKKKPEDMPKNALGIIDLSNGQVTRIERVKSFQVPEDGSGFIAYLLEPKTERRGRRPVVREDSEERVRQRSRFAEHDQRNRTHFQRRARLHVEQGCKGARLRSLVKEGRSEWRLFSSAAE